MRLSLGRSGYLCSGTLIDGTTVITAAHCCLGYNATDIKVVINDHNFGRISANVRVASVETHPKFRPKTYLNDICVLKLKMEVTGLLSEIDYAPRTKTIISVCPSQLSSGQAARSVTLSDGV